MAAAISFLIILIISLIIVKIAAIMLRLTGLSDDMAKFQARSAFTGTGFTTTESESIAKHPVRRRIIQNLMLLGNVGIVSFMSTLILTFTSVTDQRDTLVKSGILGGGILVLIIISRTGIVDWMLSGMITSFQKRFTRVYAKDYDNLLFLDGDYEVVKFHLKEDSWLVNKSMLELRLIDEGILVLGIRRDDGYYVAAPRGETHLYTGDEIIIYGREEALKDLSIRGSGDAGDREHLIMVEQQRKREGRGPEKLRAAQRAAEAVRKSRGVFGKMFRR